MKACRHKVKRLPSPDPVTRMQPQPLTLSKKSGGDPSRSHRTYIEYRARNPLLQSALEHVDESPVARETGARELPVFLDQSRPAQGHPRFTPKARLPFLGALLHGEHDHLRVTQDEARHQRVGKGDTRRGRCYYIEVLYPVTITQTREEPLSSLVQVVRAHRE